MAVCVNINYCVGRRPRVQIVVGFPDEHRASWRSWMYIRHCAVSCGFAVVSRDAPSVAKEKQQRSGTQADDEKNDGCRNETSCKPDMTQYCTVLSATVSAYA